MPDEKPKEEPEMVNGMPVIHATLDLSELMDDMRPRPKPREGDSPQPEEPDKESK